MGLLLASPLFLARCASTPTTICQEVDWYEIGRSEGAQGQPARETSTLKPRCEVSDSINLRSLYRNGHYAGLLEYCDPDNAFELGRIGQEFQDICPVSVREDFLYYYKKGRRSAELESQRQNLSQELDALIQRLRSQSIDPSMRKRLQAQAGKLKRRKNKIEEELSLLQ
jgi:hypothetical protein